MNKTARVRYDRNEDAFIVEIQDKDGTWLFCAMYPCVEQKNAQGGKNFVHFGLVNQILQMVATGYYVYKSDAES